MVLITFNWSFFVFKYTNTPEKGSIFLVGRIPLPDVHKIRIICQLFNKFLRNFTSLSGNKFPTQYIQIKLIFGSNFYDEMQLYGILGQPSYFKQISYFHIFLKKKTGNQPEENLFSQNLQHLSLSFWRPSGPRP